MVVTARLSISMLSLLLLWGGPVVLATTRLELWTLFFFEAAQVLTLFVVGLGGCRGLL